MGVLIGFLTVVHILVAVFLVVLVLMQKSKDQGVGAAFGGGVTESVFGAGTTTALVRMTIWCACIFLGSSLLLAMLHSRHGGMRESLMQKVVGSAPISAPVSAPPTAPLTEAVPTDIPATPPPAPAPAPAK